MSSINIMSFSNYFILFHLKHSKYSTIQAKNINDIKDLFLKRLLRYAKLDKEVNMEEARSHLSFLLLLGYKPEDIALNYKIFKTTPEILKYHLEILMEKYERDSFSKTNFNHSYESCEKNKLDSILTLDNKNIVRSYGSFARLNTIHSEYSLKKIHQLPPLHILNKFCFAKNEKLFLQNLVKRESLSINKAIICKVDEKLTDCSIDSRFNKNILVEKNDGFNSKVNNGVSSIQDIFKIKSTEEMIELLCSNIRLPRKVSFKVLSEKVEYLVKSGATIEDLRQNSHILNNKSLDFIKERCKNLISINLNEPLPVSTLGWTSSRFSNYLMKMGNTNISIKKDVHDTVSEIFNNLEYPILKNKRIIFSKIRFLLSLGYKSEEILKTPRLIKYGLKTIQNALEYSSKYHIGLVPLGHCLNYIENNRLLITRNCSLKNNKLIIKTLGIDNLPFLIHEKLKKIDLSNESVHQVLNFFSTLGITKEHIKELPILVCHNVKLVEDTWDSLKPCERNKISQNIIENKSSMALNYFQYYIERRINFKMTMGNLYVNYESFDLDVEQNLQEPIVYDQYHEIINTDLKNIIKRLNIDQNSTIDYIDYGDDEQLDHQELDVYAKM